MNNFGEVLGHFKKIEEAENIVPVIDDEQLRNALVGWKGVKISYKTPSNCPFHDDSSMWEWMWEQVEFDQQEFGVIAGIKAQDVGRILTRLQGLRLIYPDGTINSFARQYLTAIIMAKLRQTETRTRKSQSQK